MSCPVIWHFINYNTTTMKKTLPILTLLQFNPFSLDVPSNIMYSNDQASEPRWGLFALPS